MKRKYLSITIILLFLSNLTWGQEGVTVNITDVNGKKQGAWIKKFPDGTVFYRATFKDGIPVGLFTRYYDTGQKVSELTYSKNGTEADAVMFYPDGCIAAKGKYVNKMKEGKWKFYSSDDANHLINEETYSANKRNGISIQYYTDTTIAETTYYINDRKEGEQLHFYANGQPLFKANYSNDILNGPFEAWYSNGQLEFSGTYKNNLREGKWLFYNQDGSLKYEADYVMGLTDNKQIDIDVANYIDSLEKANTNIADPEKTGMPAF